MKRLLLCSNVYEDLFIKFWILLAQFYITFFLFSADQLNFSSATASPSDRSAASSEPQRNIRLKNLQLSAPELPPREAFPFIPLKIYSPWRSQRENATSVKKEDLFKRNESIPRLLTRFVQKILSAERFLRLHNSRCLTREYPEKTYGGRTLAYFTGLAETTERLKEAVFSRKGFKAAGGRSV